MGTIKGHPPTVVITAGDDEHEETSGVKPANTEEE